MKAKSEVRQHVQTFYNMAITQFAKKIKIIRTDNGLEFNVKKFYSSKGFYTINPVLRLHKRMR